MTTVSPVSVAGIVRTITGVLFGLTLIWAMLSLLLFRDILANQWLAGLLLALSAVAGIVVYLRYLRLKLVYDDKGFALYTGRRKVAGGQWQHFDRVSLCHRGYAQFVVRVYTPEKTSIDIPASELKIDPQAFRDCVMRWVNRQYPRAAVGQS